MIKNTIKWLLLTIFVVITLINNVNAEHLDANINHSEDVEMSDEVPVLEYVFKVLVCVIVSILFSLWFVKGVKKKKD